MFPGRFQGGFGAIESGLDAGESRPFAGGRWAMHFPLKRQGMKKPRCLGLGARGLDAAGFRAGRVGRIKFPYKILLMN